MGGEAALSERLRLEGFVGAERKRADPRRDGRDEECEVHSPLLGD